MTQHSVIYVQCQNSMPMQEVVYFNRCLLFITMFLPYFERIFITLKLDEIQRFGGTDQYRRSLFDTRKVAGPPSIDKAKQYESLVCFIQFIQS